ncbi:hypothetical protein KFU94_23795 [Chloroflexi bacterium TSY]|nr:hypothetical protein [Chloroflexi bacterium TSY]
MSDKSPDIDADTLIQFALIREIDAIFRRVDLPFWLRGGWAIDFLLGQITRSHSDIDLVTWKRHSSQVRDLLTLADFAFDSDIGIQMDFTKTGQEISIIFIGKNVSGQIFTPDVPEWIWLPNALSLPACQLCDLWCPVLSPEQMVDEKKSYKEGTGRPPRPKDLRSLEILRRYMATRGAT